MNDVLHKVFAVALALLTIVPLSAAMAASERASIAVFEPHEDFVTALTAYGLSWDILQLAAEQADIQLIAQQSSWDGAISRLKNHKVTLLFGVLKTPERENWLVFSHPLIHEGSVLYTLPSNDISDLGQIDKQRVTIGAVDKSLHQKKAAELGFSQIYPVKDSADLYQMLDNGRLDYVMLGVTLARVYCQSESRDYGSDCLKPIGEAFLYTNIHVAALKNNRPAEVILGRLDQGIRDIYSRPEISDLFAKHGFSAADYQRWQRQMQRLFHD